MYNRYPDFEELRPTGEASHIPDTKLDDGCEGAPGGNASRRTLVATLMRRRPPTASAGPVGRQPQTTSRNVGSVSPTISMVTPLTRTRQRRRHSSASSTWSSSRPRSTAPWRRAAPRRTSSLCQRGGALRRRLCAHLWSRRGAGAPASRAMALTPRRSTGGVRGGRAASQCRP